MRLTSLVIAGSLALGPGCGLAVPPLAGGALGAGIGASTGSAGHRGGPAVICGVIGVVLGLAIDVVLVGVLLDDILKSGDGDARLH